MRKDAEARSNEDDDDEKEDDGAIATAFKKAFERYFSWPVANGSGPKRTADKPHRNYFFKVFFFLEIYESQASIQKSHG